MATVFVVENTAGTLSITLQPGQLNGPGGAQRDSDMRLYGMGALLWGEGMDENILRLAENFSCPAKELNDYNPGTGSNDYDPDSDPILPKDENDLGPGKGISVPVEGQQWFNTTEQIMYVYDAVLGGWKTGTTIPVQTDVPTDPQRGDFWYDTGAASACGNPVLKVYDPIHPDADGVSGYVIVGEDFVSQCGDYMTGELSMVEPGQTNRHKITDLGDPTATYDATHKDYVDTAVSGIGGSLTSHINDDTLHLTALQNTFLDQMETNCTGFGATLAADVCHLAGYDSNSGDVYDNIDDRVLRAGDQMTSFLSLGTVGSPLIPTQDNHAVPKKYLDDQLGGALGSADRQVRFFSSAATGQGQLDGDIHVAGSIVYVWAANAWRQIFPAQYS